MCCFTRWIQFVVINKVEAEALKLMFCNEMKLAVFEFRAWE